MHNDRPLEDPRLQEALDIIRMVYERYDLAGGFYLVNAREMAFAYVHDTTWNAHVMDPDLPHPHGLQTLGFRIRARQDELGAERARELIEGSAWTIGTMKQFGHQTLQWANDCLRMLKKVGIRIDAPVRHVPHITGLDQR